MTKVSEAPSERRLWHRYVPPAVALVAILAIWAVILSLEKDKLSEPAVGLMTSLVWPSVLVITVLFFRQQIDALLATLNERVARAISFKLPGLSVRMKPVNIPKQKNNDSVGLEDVAVLHTSFFRQDKTDEINDGSTYFQIEIFIVASEATLDRVEYVTYLLDSSHQIKEYQISDRQSRFKLKLEELVNSTSIVQAELRFKGPKEPMRLNRFIDLPSGEPGN